ncbi:MAG TPA: MlaD family protein [Chitinispirillaceae bacterium]|nr:MlaD family protein [Chitinispirillaceae bacterium]
MNDRFLGYVVVTALFIFLILPVSFLIWKSATPVHSYIIEFDPINSISFLNFQDPVYEKGVEIGQVRKVVNGLQKVYATIETRKDLNFYSNYNISVIPKGIMGDRYLEIEPGTNTHQALNPTDTLSGTFILGPAEAISCVDKLRLKIEQLSGIIDNLKNGTTESKSLITNFWNSVETIDSLSSSIAAITGMFELQTGQKLDSITELLKKSTLITENFSTTLPSFLKKVESLIIQSNNLVLQLKTFSDHSVSVAKQINSPDLPIWNDKLSDLQRELRNIIKIIDNLQVEGLKLPIRLSRHK